MYKAISDTHEPTADELRRDMRPYSAAYQRYLQLPETLDPRIIKLARSMILEGTRAIVTTRRKQSSGNCKETTAIRSK